MGNIVELNMTTKNQRILIDTFIKKLDKLDTSKILDIRDDILGCLFDSLAEINEKEDD